ncbi:MAG: hypothetical protein ACK4RK_00005, partial [Gemmataceae bacterium]
TQCSPPTAGVNPAARLVPAAWWKSNASHQGIHEVLLAMVLPPAAPPPALAALICPVPITTISQGQLLCPFSSRTKTWMEIILGFPTITIYLTTRVGKSVA